LLAKYYVDLVLYSFYPELFFQQKNEVNNICTVKPA